MTLINSEDTLGLSLEIKKCSYTAQVQFTLGIPKLINLWSQMKDWGGGEKSVNEKFLITDKARRKRIFNIHF